MSRVAALPLTDEQRALLERWVRAGTTPQRLVFRSRIVLLAASGMPSKHVAQRLDTSQDTVRLWRRRLAIGGPEALRHDAPGRGRKRQITAAREQQVVDATLHTAPPRATQWSLRSSVASAANLSGSAHGEPPLWGDDDHFGSVGRRYACDSGIRQPELRRGFSARAGEGRNRDRRAPGPAVGRAIGVHPGPGRLEVRNRAVAPSSAVDWPMRHHVSSPAGAHAFVEEHGVVLEGGRGPVPSLVEAIAGEAIRGTWWGHPKGRAIFRATRAVRDSADVLVCRLVGGKITYIHRRLWPALVRLADEIGPARLAAIREEHTTSGAHKLVTMAFPQWVPTEVRKAAKRLSEGDARRQFGDWMTSQGPSSSRTSR